MPVSCKVDTAVLSSTRGSQEGDKCATKKCIPALTNIFIGQGRPYLSNMQHLLAISLCVHNLREDLLPGLCAFVHTEGD